MTTVTRIWPPARGGGGGPTILYTTYDSPWAVASPHVTVGWGSVGYEDGSNALFFVAENTPVAVVPF